MPGPVLSNVLMTTTDTWPGATGFAFAVGQDVTGLGVPIFTEKSLPKGTGMMPVNTREATAAANITDTER